MSSDQASSSKPAPYFQNRELSWLEFNKRVLDQGMDPSVPLFERLNFLSIFWSNLQEFFMIRVGSLADLSLLKTPIIDSKTGMSTVEQLSAIYKRCHELYPEYDKCYKQIRKELSQKGVLNKRDKNLDSEQRSYIETFFEMNVMPFLSPQIVNSRHPFPHLENGALYVVVRLDEEATKSSKKKESASDSRKDKTSKNVGAEGVTLGIIPLPAQCKRIIRLPGQGLQYMLLEHVIEMFVAKIFSMYKVKHTNVICVTRNADLDATEGAEEQGDDYREHIKRILKKRTRLMPVRLESERELSTTVKGVLLDKLKLEPTQIFSTPVPLDLSYVYDLPSLVDDETRKALSFTPFTPEWPTSLDRRKPLIPQIEEKDILISYPYESMDSFVQLLKEAAFDPNVTSIKITLYRISKQSSIAEALVAAAENGKEVTALFELRARFDESNNIEYSQRLEEAGCNVLYGFRDYKVHSKICCITRRIEGGVEYITQVGTGNYNEKTAKLYTDFSFMTCDHKIGRDAAAFFRNMTLENMSDEYRTLWVAPLQIKQNILRGIDKQILRKKKGLPNGLFFKTNSITDKDIIDKIVEASQAGVKCTLLVRGISCIIPGITGYTDNVCVVSIVGRLLEHSRIYLFGAFDDEFDVYLSSADLMTRNMDKRIEVAWPVKDESLRRLLLGYIGTCMADTAKLRDLLPNKKYTDLGYFAKENKSNGEVVLFDSQNYLINQAQQGKLLSDEFVAATAMPNEAKVRDYAEEELELTELMVDSKRLEAIAQAEKLFDKEKINASGSGQSDSVLSLERNLSNDLGLQAKGNDNAVADANHGDKVPASKAKMRQTQPTLEEQAKAQEKPKKPKKKVVKVVKGKKSGIKKKVKAKNQVEDLASERQRTDSADGMQSRTPAQDQRALYQMQAMRLQQEQPVQPVDEVEVADMVEEVQTSGFSDASKAQSQKRKPEKTLGIDGFNINPQGGSFSLSSSVLEEAQADTRNRKRASNPRTRNADDQMIDNGQFVYIEPTEELRGNSKQGTQPIDQDAYHNDANDLLESVEEGAYVEGGTYVEDSAYVAPQEDAAFAYGSQQTDSSSASIGAPEYVNATTQPASIDLNDPRYRAIMQQKWQEWIQKNPELYQQYLQQRSLQYRQLKAQQMQQALQAQQARQVQQSPRIQQPRQVQQPLQYADQLPMSDPDIYEVSDTIDAYVQPYDDYESMTIEDGYEQDVAEQAGGKRKSWLRRLLSGE